MKTIVYGGYEFRVPVNWPVYRLDEYPATCVRYDVHAVYLGTPGANMRCPARLVGRTQTVSVIPGTARAAGSAAPTAGHRVQVGLAGGTPGGSPLAPHGTVTANPAEHELRAALGAAASGATVLVTYGENPAVADQVLATLRTAPTGAAATTQSGPSPGMSSPAAGPSPLPVAPAALAAAHPPPTTTPPTTTPPPAPAPTPTATGTPAAKRKGQPPVKGFDVCTAPSLATMGVWRRDYAAVGIYIGGVNAACAPGNLSAAWIRSVAARGYGMLPTYVGPQAPCWGFQGVTITQGKAAAEGRRDGLDAISDARHFGLGAGSPIYYDMESYKAANGSACGTAVLNYLSAWDKTVTAAGYLSGVYSSRDTGIADIEAAVTAKRPGFTAPDAIWFADWNGVSSLASGKLIWPFAARDKQYQGNVNVTVGGITLNIDSDLAGRTLAR